MSSLPGRRNSRSQRERTWIALTLFAFGAFIAWHATSYQLGSLRRMGPGYFPLMLGVAMCLFATLIFVLPNHQDTIEEIEEEMADARSSATEGAVDQGNLHSRLRAVGFILGAMIVFSLMIRTAGFAPATAVTTFVAGLAEPENSLWDLGLLSVGITVFASLVFVVGLGIPVPIVAF